MRLAVMQPYLFPYLGYFQLMHSVDRFVLFDDVAFIKRGWINRNRILLDGDDYLFTIPLEGASQNRRICDIETVGDMKWKSRLLKTVERAYRGAPHFDSTFALMEATFATGERNIARLIAHSVDLIARHIGLCVRLVATSQSYENSRLKGQDRILDICMQERATAYHNAIGGQELYDHGRFAWEGIELRFIRPHLREYAHKAATFIPGLSIIDVLMWNDVSTVRAMASEYDVV
jgi:hypothetical protein